MINKEAFAVRKLVHAIALLSARTSQKPSAFFGCDGKDAQADAQACAILHECLASVIDKGFETLSE
jgi:hypothetical protein